MKKQLILAAVIILSTLGYGQGKFFTDNFSKEVTELTTEMKTVGFTITLPSNYTKYDDIVTVIDKKDEGLDSYYVLNFFYNILPTKEVVSGGKIKYVINSGSNTRSDFTSLFRRDMDVDFNLFHSLDYKARTFRYQTVAIKIMGRLKDGMHWVNEEYVQKWKYEELSFSEIKLDLGEPEPTYTTEKGLFTYEKYKSGNTLTKIYPNEETEDLKVIYAHGEDYDSKMIFSIYEIKAGEVKQQTFDMGGPAPTAYISASVDDMLKELKLNLKKQLVKRSCYNEARSVKLEGQRIAESKIFEGVYAPYMLDSDKKSANAGTKAGGTLKSIGGQFFKPKAGSDKYNKFINSSDSDLKWEEKQFGNKSFEFLELDFYRSNQCESIASNKSKSLKEGEEGKTQKVIIFLAKIDGKLYAGSFTKEETEDMNAEDVKFKDFVLSTFKVNK